MNTDEFIELVEIAKTLKEHADIITKFNSFHKINRIDALDKYRKFNAKHPDYIIANGSSWQMVDLGETCDENIVYNLAAQRNWLIGKATIKYGKIINEIVNGNYENTIF